MCLVETASHVSLPVPDSPSREARRVKALGALSQQQRQQHHLVNPSFATH